MKKATKNIFSIVVLGLVIKTISLLYKIISTRMLGLEGIRIISIISPLLALALSLSSFQTHIVTNQNIASNIKTGKTKVSVILLSSLKITMTSSCIISIFILLSAPLYKIVYQDTFMYYPMILCIPLIFLANISGLMKAYLEAYNKFYYVYIANTVEMVFKILLTVGLLVIFSDVSIKLKVVYVFGAMLISESISLLILAFKLKGNINKTKLKTKTNKYELKMLKQALPLTIDSLISSFGAYIAPFVYYFALNKINVSTYDGTTYYALVCSYAIPLLICGQFPVMTIANVMFPSLAKNKDDNKSSSLFFEKSLVLGLAISIFTLVLCQNYAYETLMILYGDARSYDIVIFLAPIYFFLYLNPLFVSLLQARKKEKNLLYVTIFTQILNIIFIYLFSSNLLFNTTGYIVGISISGLIRFVILLILALRELKYKFSYKLIVYIVIIILYYIINYLNPTFITYVISTLVFFPLYLLLYFHSYKNKSEYHQAH